MSFLDVANKRRSPRQEAYEIPELIQPDEYEARLRKEAVRKNYVSDNFRDDLGPVNTIRDHIWGQLSRKKDVPRVDLKGIIDEIEYRNANKPPKAARRPRPLPSKLGMDDLLDIVVNLKRDVKLIKDAQSAAGAKDWIIRNGLEKHLYVDERDFDGDGIPDIVVRTREGDQPYIVKGYTTDKSNYPDRYRYHTTYPLKENRKGHPMREYLEDQMIDSYSDYGFTRNLKPEADEYAKRVKRAGYNAYHPRPKLSYIQAFKNFVFKPLLSMIKEFYKESHQSLRLPPTYVRELEGLIRDNIVTIPVLTRVYDLNISDLNLKQYWTRLTQRKEVRDGCELVTKYLIDNFTNKEVYIPMLTALLNDITTQKDENGPFAGAITLREGGPPASVAEIVETIVSFVADGDYGARFIHKRLKRTGELNMY
jgi:hypothetical protein